MAKLLKSAGLAAGVLAFSTISSHAVTTIGFEGLDASPGQPVPLTSFSEGGLSFSLSFTSADGQGRGPVIFDTTCAASAQACSDDPDLIPSVQGENGIFGNVLVLQEELDSNVPDDDVQGGTITFEITGAAKPVIWKGASGIDDDTWSFIDKDGATIDTLSLSNENETGSVGFMSSVLGVGDSFSIEYAGSGGIDSLKFQAVPLPAPILMLLSALAGLGFISARSRRA